MTYKEKLKKVKGKKNADILVFALSTCGWCKKTKDLLNSLGVEYNFIDVDLLEDKEKSEVEDFLDKFNSSGFPTIIINNITAIQGFDENKLRKAVNEK